MDNEDEIIPNDNENIINKYFTFGIWQSPRISINISLARLAIAQLCPSINISLAGLAIAQLYQSYEKDGDTVAVEEVGINNKDAINCIQKIYHPNTDTWPLYAKIQNLYFQVRLFALSLPIIKQHTAESTSSHDRKDHIETLIPNAMAA
jgi:hypothetical protein